MAAALVSPLLRSRARAQSAPSSEALSRIVCGSSGSLLPGRGETNPDQSPHRQYYARACHAAPCPPGQPIQALRDGSRAREPAAEEARELAQSATSYGVLSRKVGNIMPALATRRPARQGSLFRRSEMAAAIVSPLLRSRARARNARRAHER